MGIHPLTLVSGTIGFFVLGFAIHPVFFWVAAFTLGLWALRFVSFLSR